MSSDIAISVKNLTKTYRLFNHPGDRIRQAVTLGRVKFHKEFTALKNVSFEVKKGETVGIIGRNGSGKSTLLQLICGILKPTSGSIIVNGRISALLELGSGFNPEFTGRENIYFQGAIMGFSKEEMDAKVEDIIAFADIGEFIDQPVRTYSSGMFVRLAFATAIHAEPDILVIDEALAVGDMDFQKKSFAYMSNLMTEKQVTIILVSHHLRQIQRFCSKSLYLKNGVNLLFGDSQSVCQQYYESTYSENNQTTSESIIVSTDELELVEVKVFNEYGAEASEIDSGDSVRIKFVIRLNRDMRRPEFIVGTQSSDGMYLSSSSTAELDVQVDLKAGQHEIEYVIDQFPLAPGKYQIRLEVRDYNFRQLYSGRALKAFWVKPDIRGATKPMRLLNLKASLHIDGKNLAEK